MKLSRPSLSSTALIALVSLYFTVVLNYAFFHKAWVLNQADGGSIVFFCTLPVVLFFALNLVLQVIALPWLHKIIVPLLLVASAAVSYQALFFDIYFDKTMLTNVLQTQWAESSRLITPAYVAWIVALGVLPATLYIWTKVNYQRLLKEGGYRLAMMVISLLAIGGVAKGFYQDYASFFRNHKEMVHLLTPSNIVGAGVGKYKEWRVANMPYSELDLAAKQDKPDEYRHFTVLIVGETTRAQNWGLNGYARQTTQNLPPAVQKLSIFLMCLPAARRLRIPCPVCFPPLLAAITMG